MSATPPRAPDRAPPAAAPAPTAEQLDELAAGKVLPVRHPWRWIASLVVVVLLAQFVHALVTNPVFQWQAFGYWFFRPVIIRGLVLTLELTGCSALFGLLGGVLLALMRLSRSPLLQAVSWGYIWIFRSIPLKWKLW